MLFPLKNHPAAGSLPVTHQKISFPRFKHCPQKSDPCAPAFVKPHIINCKDGETGGAKCIYTWPGFTIWPYNLCIKTPPQACCR